MQVWLVQLLGARASLSGPGGNIGVAVAAVVVVLAIVAVIVMVVRSNGGGRNAARGVGYDPHQGPLGQPRADYDSPDSPWARPGNAAGPAGQQGPWQAGAGAPGGGAGYGQRGSAAWGQGPQEMQQAQPNGGWGHPAGPRWNDAASQPAGAWGEPENVGAGWGAAPGGQPGVGMRDQGPNAWDAPAAQQPGAGADQRGWVQPRGANAAPPAAPAWGQPEPAAPWNQPQSAAPAWGQPEPTPAGGGWNADAQSNAPAAFAPPQPTPPWNAPQGGQPAGPVTGPGGWNAGSVPSGANWGMAPNTPEPAAAPGWGQTPAPSMGGPQQGQPFDNAGFAAFGGPMERGAIPAQPPASTQRPGVIIVRQGKEPGRVFEMRNDRLTIGRSRDSDVFLEDLAVSRLHATVFRDASGQYIVRDENSANGTTVNGQRIGEHVLEEGDEIALGQTLLAFQRR